MSDTDIQIETARKDLQLMLAACQEAVHYGYGFRYDTLRDAHDRLLKFLERAERAERALKEISQLDRADPDERAGAMRRIARAALAAPESDQPVTNTPDLNSLAENVKSRAAILTSAPVERKRWDAFMVALRQLVAHCEEVERQLDVIEKQLNIYFSSGSPIGRAALAASGPDFPSESEVRKQDEMLSALEFYADPSSYEEGSVPHPTQHGSYVVPITADSGALARAALAASGPDTPK